MSMIYVRAKPGRVVRESPRGNFIPADAFVPVKPSVYIDRLINVHGDLEVQKSEPKPKTDKPAGEVKKTS